ncbi:acetylglutamate kinase, partial [Campylobacter coli]|nr:acetylglutamate kinase [Campylobacter coli]
MQKYLEKANVLIEALPYIRKFSSKIILIKYGGSAMENGELKHCVMQDIALLKLVG